MVLYKIAFIEIMNDDENKEEVFLTQKEYRSLMQHYKKLKGLR